MKNIHFFNTQLKILIKTQLKILKIFMNFTFIKPIKIIYFITLPLITMKISSNLTRVSN